MYSLSEDGGIEKYSRNGSVVEQISEAGLSSGTPGYGYVNRIRHISGELYVCGYNGQIYRRTEVGWSHVHSGLLQKPAITAEQAISTIENALSLTDINGKSIKIFNPSQRNIKPCIKKNRSNGNVGIVIIFKWKSRGI